MNKRRRTSDSPANTPVLRLVGKDERASASSNYGPVRAGLITTRRTEDQVLTELLNSLENKIADQSYRFSEVCATLASVTERLVRLYASTLDTDTIDNEQKRE